MFWLREREWIMATVLQQIWRRGRDEAAKCVWRGPHGDLQGQQEPPPQGDSAQVRSWSEGSLIRLQPCWVLSLNNTKNTYEYLLDLNQCFGSIPICFIRVRADPVWKLNADPDLNITMIFLVWPSFPFRALGEENKNMQYRYAAARTQNGH